MEPTKIYPIIAVLSLVTVEYGGWALLSFVSTRTGQLNDFQMQFFRAGHAHAGVLLVLSLVYFLYLANNTDFPKPRSGRPAPSCWPESWPSLVASSHISPQDSPGAALSVRA
jgi:hypothetical protein